MMQDHMINAQIDLPIETMEIVLEKDPSTIKLEPGETQDFISFPLSSKERFLAEQFIAPTRS